MKTLILKASMLCMASSVWAQQKQHVDQPFIQEYAIKYIGEQHAFDVETDRNGNIQLLNKQGLYKPAAGAFLIPGTIVQDYSYRFMKDKTIVDLEQLDGDFVYLDKDVIFTNAWSGEVYIPHKLQHPTSFIALSTDTYFMASADTYQLIEGGKVAWTKKVQSGSIQEIIKGRQGHEFYVLTNQELLVVDVKKKQEKSIYKGSGYISLALHADMLVLAHKEDGLCFLDRQHQVHKKLRKLPSLQLEVVRSIDDNLWVGSAEGAFRLHPDESIKYYASKRWVQHDHVVDIKKHFDGSILLLNKGGMTQLVSQPMTLAEKASYYEKQVRRRHVRNGLTATLAGLKDGDISMGYLSDSDNDGLWTSMYLAGQAFRYAVTKDPEALLNTQESLDAMERLYSVNPVRGFPARSYERTGHKQELSDPERWQKSADIDWDWKATTSSDEAIGHIFAFGVVAETVDDPAVKKQAIRLIDSMMTHIVDNDLYLIDYDGKPTEWAKWNPSYVNGFSKNVGDRKLNSSNIIAMLQTAYHFTQKEVFKTTAMDLIEQHGYLDNLMQPMHLIGQAEQGQDDLSKLLSVYWNHSDDEMYFLGYWGLYRYAFNAELKEKYKAAIYDHWEIEKPEKDGLWNIITAIIGIEDPALDDAIWYLQKYPLDLVQWSVKNSHRQDLDTMETNFRRQYIQAVLPPDELKIARHNGNRFTLDGVNNGTAENSAGDIWLLPYWMGKFLNIIK